MPKFECWPCPCLLEDLYWCVSPSLKWRKPNPHYRDVRIVAVFSCSVVSHSLLPHQLAHQAPLSMGFPRQEYWRGLPISFSRGSSQPKECTLNLLHWQANSLPLSHQRSPDISFSSVQFSRSVVSDSLRPHESQHARPPCPSPTPGVHSDSRPTSQWCHPTIIILCCPLLLLPPIPPSIAYYSPKLPFNLAPTHWQSQTLKAKSGKCCSKMMQSGDTESYLFHLHFFSSELIVCWHKAELFVVLEIQ